MALKHYKPTSPGVRGKIGIHYRAVLSGHRPHKSLTRRIRRSHGRNSFGRITMRHHGGGGKHRYRTIDFRQDKLGISARVETVEYDPYRSAFIGLLVYRDGEKRYSLLPEGVTPGTEVISGDNVELNPGNRTRLKSINPGIPIFNIELVPGGGGKLVRSAGSGATVSGLDGKYAIVRMPSGETRKLVSECFATIGQASNADHKNIRLAKAGIRRQKGIRPTVRGKAMNLREHPYGGKFNQPRGTRRPKDMWGNITGGRRTRSRKKTSSRFILERRKK